MRMLKACNNCGYEHYFEDFSPSNCENCNFKLIGDANNAVSKNLFKPLAKPTLSKNLFKRLVEPAISENLIGDLSIWEILQPPGL